MKDLAEADEDMLYHMFVGTGTDDDRRHQKLPAAKKFDLQRTSSSLRLFV